MAFNYADFSCLCDWKAGSPYYQEAESGSKELKNTMKTKRKNRNFQKLQTGSSTGFTVIYLQSLQCCADAVLHSCILNQQKYGKEKADSSNKKTLIQSH